MSGPVHQIGVMTPWYNDVMTVDASELDFRPYFRDECVELHHGQAATVLRKLRTGSAATVVTSPPYYCQRDYGVDGQIGLEPTPAEYVTRLVEVFREARRVLADDGTLWLNLGDTYYSAKGRPHGHDPKHRSRRMSELRPVDGPGLGLPRKSLIGIPWRVALALQDDGWTLRSNIIWRRTTVLGEPSARDRPWRQYEHVFLFSKRPRYHFDRSALRGEEDIWTIEPSRGGSACGEHFATYPQELPERCILAGSRRGDAVLDPFCGSATTGAAAVAAGRRFVGIDLSATYLDLALRTRLRQYPLTALEAVEPGRAS